MKELESAVEELTDEEIQSIVNCAAFVYTFVKADLERPMGDAQKLNALSALSDAEKVLELFDVTLEEVRVQENCEVLQ